MILNFTSTGGGYLNIDTKNAVFNENYDRDAHYITVSFDDFMMIHRKLDRDAYGYRDEISERG